MVRRSSIVVLFLLLLLSPAPASAAIIGVFGWDYDPFTPDSRFSVLNTSADPFDNVVIELFAPDDTSLGSESLGTITPSFTPTNTIQFYPFFLGSELDRAQLTFLYLSNRVTVDLFASGLMGDPESLMAGGMDIPFDASVPEPGSLVLLLSGMGGMWLRRRKRPHPGRRSS